MPETVNAQHSSVTCRSGWGNTALVLKHASTHASCDRNGTVTSFPGVMSLLVSPAVLGTLRKLHDPEIQFVKLTSVFEQKYIQLKCCVKGI